MGLFPRSSLALGRCDRDPRHGRGFGCRLFDHGAAAHHRRGPSGRKIVRFKAFERFSHWLTAVSFVILGLTGLNITFGKILLLPVIGPDAFSSVSQTAKYVHNFTSFSFVAGLILIIVIFFKDNIPEKVDLEWLKQGGGFIKNDIPPAGRFNRRREGRLLAFACRRRVCLGVGLCSAISLLRN